MPPIDVCFLRGGLV